MQLEAEAELLDSQIGTAKDKHVRLSLEKKLAASSQKFADAARLSAELKALAAKVEADRAAHAIMGQQIEGARAAVGVMCSAPDRSCVIADTR